ncbi:uncharacterized protein LOC123199303 isoform X2 [Mangifera indica]|uniref:uncharacterized protein LOC123199303 isoform X2 n=1 Tax=Mangifera indica TaxID=29780 RepID=UPI001CFBB1E6|nr:uncharacterized protein LOC123199303 isoform X2 [Mangifera indica]
MSRDSKFSQLYRLINDSVRPYAESEIVSLTKEQEKELLVSLSQILKKIQLWTRELDCDSYDELEISSEDHLYLFQIIADMVFLLGVKSHFVQHLAGNILVIISELLSTSGSNWNLPIRSLFCCMELAVINILSIASTPSKAELGYSNIDSSSFVGVIKPRLKYARWSSLAGIVRILRNILKYLKQEYGHDDSLTEAYLHSVYSCFSTLPWDSMDLICGTRTADEEESKVVFLGNFIQLLCSLVEHISSVDNMGSSLDKHLFLSLVTKLVPKLLYWCLGEPEECAKTHISQYFRHKLLVLMIRLSFHARLDDCMILSWLHLLHNYFKELLQQPITEVESVQDDCLEGSPFLMSVTDGELYNMGSHHLQRQAVFLFLRCSFTLVSLKEDTKKHCACSAADSCLTFDANSDLDCCGRKKGLLELYKWLQRHLPIDKIVDYEIYMEKCINFSLSFLQLYMHEDDELLRMLLQLLDIPVCGTKRKNWSFQDVKADILFHLSHVFNPVHLFHLFLAELHYDHQVLLDYLISKDTGIHCAEYLLRCLRMVCDSWPLFKEFLAVGKFTNQSSDKRRKIILDSPKFQGRLQSTTLENSILSLQEEYDCDRCGTRGSYYNKAYDCLISLKTSMENLHQKNLFLYNPEVLLKRLTRFEELCTEQCNHDNS